MNKKERKEFILGAIALITPCIFTYVICYIVYG